MQMTTVFDGLVPASANPGVVPGVAVVVWTPTKSGVYSIILSAPDEPGAPFMFANDIIVDVNAAAPGIQAGPLFGGSVVDEFQQDADVGPFLSLETFRGAPVRVVVRVGVVAYADGSPVPVAGPRVVLLADLKRALGIEASFVDDDALLVDLENQAVAFVESQTERTWGEPAQRTVFINGLGVRTLYLPGHIEAAAGPGSIVTVRQRSMASPGDWEVADETMFERRGNTLIRIDVPRWSHLGEYEVTFTDGYTLGTAPKDIQALIIDLVSIAYSGLGEEGVKSETLGDYSYTLDAAVTAAAASMGDSSLATLNRYRRIHI